MECIKNCQECKVAVNTCEGYGLYDEIAVLENGYAQNLENRLDDLVWQEKEIHDENRMFCYTEEEFKFLLAELKAKKNNIIHELASMGLL